MSGADVAFFPLGPYPAGKTYAVLGLARSGLATVGALASAGAHVVAWDDREEARRAAAALGARIADPLAVDLSGFAAVVVSPGVPLNRHPIAGAAKAAGVPVIGDIELFAQARASLPAHKVVGITGTNGKSTTTALIHHILKTAGVPSLMGGNIGLPILSQQPLPEGGVYVLELSSYQIDLTFSLDCDVAVLLNVTPDHLDRYESFEAYRAAKLRLFEMQTSEHTGILAMAWDDEDTYYEARLKTGKREGYAPRKWISPGDRVAEYRTKQQSWPTLQGPHNLQNLWAAANVCMELGVKRRTVMSKLATYPGLPHRMERVGEANGVLFINDSKATNAESTAPALAAFPACRWIVGGRAKTADLDACLPQLGHVRAAYTIGEAGPAFATLLRAHVPVTESETLDHAVAAAARDAAAGEVVLLSPACASFDQFRDFEHRGDVFRELVAALPPSGDSA